MDERFEHELLPVSGNASAFQAHNAAAYADVELLDYTRLGCTAAFAEVWRRHHGAALRAARAITDRFDPDDLVAESFTRVLQALHRGKGPSGAFRPYLYATMRNLSTRWTTEQAIAPATPDLLDTLVADDDVAAMVEEALEQSVSVCAFRALPQRWQEVLWYGEVEQLSPREIAPILGIKPNAVSALRARAREAFKDAWIQAHLNAGQPHRECGWVVARLGAYTRGTVSRRERSRVTAHLADCGSCLVIASEADQLAGRLASVLLPLAIGASASATLFGLTAGGTEAAAATAGGEFPSASNAAPPGTPIGGTGALPAVAETSRTTMLVGIAASVVVLAAGWTIYTALPLSPADVPSGPGAQHSEVRREMPVTEPLAGLEAAAGPEEPPVGDEPPSAAQPPPGDTPRSGVEPSAAPDASPGPSPTPPPPLEPLAKQPVHGNTTAPCAVTQVASRTDSVSDTSTLDVRGTAPTDSVVSAASSIGDFRSTSHSDGTWQLEAGPFPPGSYPVEITVAEPDGTTRCTASVTHTYTSTRTSTG